MVVTEDLKGRDFLSMIDFTREEIETMLLVGIDLKKRFVAREDHRHILPGRTLFMVFYNDSLRTRNSFEAGMTQLGGHAHFLQPGAIYTPALPGDEIAYETERISDVARVLSRMGDAIAIRIYGKPTGWIYGKGHKIQENFAYWSKIPVINMEDDIYHPCQGMADIMTIYEKCSHDFNKLQGKKFVMSWAYSAGQKPLAVPQTGVLAPSMFGMDVTLACPPEFDLHTDIIKKVEEHSNLFGGTFTIERDMKTAFEGADFVYPKSWGVLEAHGIEGVRPAKPEIMPSIMNKYKNYWKTTVELMDITKNSRGYYMHCLPQDRGMEVDDEVADGDRSIIFDQAENRLHAQKGVMTCIMD